MTLLTLLALVFICVGGLVTLLFWLPKVVNRPRLKEFLGNRYPLVLLFYFTNGPFLLLIGLYLLWFQCR
ncbi:MAG: hypothetical protein C0613_00075 [Desulfobulbaceae bacterium]|nr:MAG: hypothetical protein C0613_00075 [Desulfobulbaceae bacterium]